MRGLNRLRVNSFVSGSIFATSAALVCAPAAAQEAAASSATQLQEIVVTAQKRSENVQEVPIAITALSSADLEARGIKNMTDLASQVPGVNFGEVGIAPQIFVRGVGFNTISGVGETPIAVHIDGAYLPHPGSIGMLQRDLERVEFLRGPQGTLYGRNATGGVLNFISAAPREEFGGGAFASYGNYDAYEVSGYLTGAVADNVRARIFVEKDHHDGYVTNLSSDVAGQRKYDGFEGVTGRLSLDFDLSPQTVLSLRAFSRSEDFSGPVLDPINKTYASTILGQSVDVLENSLLSFDPYEMRTDLPADGERKLYGASARLDHNFGDVDLVSTTAWSRYKYSASFDTEGTLLPALRADPNADRARTFTQELNLLGNSDHFDWIVGAYYLRDHDKFQGYAAITNPGDTSPYTFLAFENADQVFQTMSAFVDLTYKATADVSIYGGVRGIYEKTHYERDIFNGYVASAGDPPPPPPAGYACSAVDGGFGDERDDRTTVTGRFGAKYQLTSESNLYAQYSRGDKSGVYNPASCTPKAKPEKMNAFEIGAKNTLMSGALQLNLSAYYYDYKNTQVEEIVVPSIIFKNADSEIYGLDLETVLRPSEHLKLNLGANLMSAKYTEYQNGDFLNLFLPGYDPDTNQKGNYLNRAPVWTLNFGAQYDHPLSVGTLRFRTDVASSGKYYLRPYNLEDDKQTGFTKIDGSVAFIASDERWQVRGFIKNATDKATLAGMIIGGFGQEGVYAAPRTYGAELSYKF